MTDVAATEALGESLSPSQATTYLACPAKWYFRYLVGLTEPTTGALAQGKAFHGTLARNFRQKMNTGCDMENGELPKAFAEEWSLAITDAALRDDEDEADLATTGRILVEAYLSEAARSNAFTSAFKELEAIPQYKATAKLAGFLQAVRSS